MKPSNPLFKLKTVTRIGLMVLFLTGGSSQVMGQQGINRQTGISAISIQGLRFGTFYQGVSGGAVIIAPDGTCTVTGTVIEIASGNGVGAASIEVQANPGTVISLLSTPDIILTGSNGGKMKLHLGATQPSSPLTIKTLPPATTRVNLGGTLTVGSPASNPAGAYSGTFLITFMQE